MKTIIFINTQKSGSSRDAIKVAEKMGYYTILLTNNHKQIEQREEYPDVHLMKYCKFDDLDKIKLLINNLLKKGLNLIAIVSFVDSYCYIANLLAKEFGLNHFTIEAIKKMEDKLLSRNCIKDSKYSPKFKIINKQNNISENDLKSDLPAILKFSNSTGSKDVYLVNNYKEFSDIYNSLSEKYPEGNFILEEFIQGNQCIAEVLVINSNINIISIIDQEISYLNNHFIVTGYYLNLDEIEKNKELKKAIKEIVSLHGLTNGACHLELRFSNGNWKLIEINPRISGGGMNSLIEEGTGINLVEQTLNLILGEKVDLNRRFKKHVFIQYTTSLEDGVLEKVTGANITRNTKNVLKVYIKPRKGNKVCRPTSMGNRYAYVIAEGNNRNEAENNSKEAIKQLKFHLTN